MSELLPIRAVFMRGGTSKALVFHRKDLPADREAWTPLFLAALGSPDPNGRQLDGMGGGLSSLSKICVVEPSSDPSADIDFTFVQVLVDEARADYSANCGNMSSAIGPFAVDEGLLPAPRDGSMTVRIRNTNTGKHLDATFTMRDGAAAVNGEHRVDGVAGSGSAIRLDFLDQGGAATGRLLPTGRVQDAVDVPGIGTVPFSFVDAANPCMFIPAEAVGASGRETPREIEADANLLERLETVRRHGSIAGGAASDLEGAALSSVPRIAMVARPADAILLSGETLEAERSDILVRMISRGKPHRAVTVTAGLCLAVACRLPGSIPYGLLAGELQGGDRDLRIGHPSGVMMVAAEVRDAATSPRATRASLYLTARRLFQGEVMIPASRAR